MDNNMGSSAMVSQIFGLFETGEEAIQYLNVNGLTENRYLLQDMESLCIAIASAIEQLVPQITLKNKLKEIGLNAPLTVSRICRTLDDEDTENAYMQYTCSFVPLFSFWRRYAEFFLIHAIDEKTLKSWHEEESTRIRQIREMPKKDVPQEYHYDFSIVVLFYGNQEMTKECLDAIKTYTKNRSYELITFDNGSDLETTAWCQSLPHIKKIYYPHNLGSSVAGNLIFTMAPYYMEGKYLLFISNDVIVTPRYDEILYQCMESNPCIGMAAPVCNSASNSQAISVPYAKDDMKAMTAFAERYNQCDPHKWQRRARLFSVLACFRPQVLQKMRLAEDPLFCYDMFSDDDFSSTLRRMGYWQVLCRDVFVHHYGSATIGDDQYQVMDLGRAQFYQKHGVDAWGSLGTDLCTTLSSFSVNMAGSIRILALNPQFGESVLALCNQLRACGSVETSVDALTEDARYLDDMAGLFHRGGMLHEEGQVLEGQYDIAIVGSNLGWCVDLRAVLHTATNRLKSGGLLITQYENFFSLANLNAALQEKLSMDGIFAHDPYENSGLRIITDNMLESILRQKGMVLETTVSLTNDGQKPVADRIFAVLGIQQQDGKENLLLSLGKFNVWRKTS